MSTHSNSNFNQAKNIPVVFPEFPNQYLRKIGEGIRELYDRTSKHPNRLLETTLCLIMNKIFFFQDKGPNL